MKKILLALWLACGLAGGALAAGGGIAWDKFPQGKLTDLPALQNGAKLFVNHCLSCHSAAFMRYNRLTELGLTEAQIKANLMFAGDKIGDTMKSTLDARQAKEWLGNLPPDLTLIARSRAAVGQGTGADYLYTFLRTYYRDDTKATGWNNLVFPSVGMPHVLWLRQGERDLTLIEVRATKDAAGKVAGWEELRTMHAADGTGSQARKALRDYHGNAGLRYEFTAKDPAQAARFDDEVADLVAFLQWMGEPAQGRRVQIGVWVLMFLGLFILIAWRLNAAYWKDVK